MELTGIHINADLGEDFGRYQLVDLDELLPYLDACNIACGFHAGDPPNIDKTLDKAKHHQLEIGAHPSYPDLQGFGRRSMQIAKEELKSILRYQIAALSGMAKSKGITLTHVKPHGALYNDAARSREVAQAVCEAVLSISPALTLYVPPNSIVAEQALECKMNIKYEAFIDRTYNGDLTLTSRSETGALITNADEAYAHAHHMYVNKQVSTKGEDKLLQADTFCIHGDNPGAVEILKRLHDHI